MAVVLGVTVASCSGPSTEQLDQAKDECVSFFQSKRLGSGNKVEAKDTWEKDGKLVVELAERSVLASDSSYTQELCVVDFEKGEIELPSAYERERWAE